MRADGHRVPDLHQERLHVVRQPEALRIRVFDRHQDIFHADHRPLGHRLDGEGEPALVLIDDVLPALSVELEAGREVALVVGRGLVDARLRHDFPREVALQEILQAEKTDLVVLAAPALKVGVHGLGPRRVLSPVAHLVRVREEEEVVHRCRSCGARETAP